MKIAPLLLVWLALLQSATFSQDRIVTGRVIDEQGMPLARAVVSGMWTANGSETRVDGSVYDLEDKKQLHEYYGQIGKMEPYEPAHTAEDGTFRLTLSSDCRALLAMDATRKVGRIVEITDGERSRSPITMQLVPLVKVIAEFRTSVATESVDWCHAWVELPEDPKYPLANNRLIACGSFDRRFEVWLPPGIYQLNANGWSNVYGDTFDSRVNPVPQFTIGDKSAQVDLGVLTLTPAVPSRIALERKSKDESRWKDINDRYGELAPEWHSVDGRGIDHAKNIAQLRGKWVLLDFWGLGCIPCLKSGIPNLMEFYEKNARFKSRFEVVGVCIDVSGEIDTMAKLESKLAAIETNVWKGKRIPFPIVLDSSFTSWERFGIPGLGTIVLVDPEGRLVEGDETTLQEILQKAEQSNEPKSRNQPPLK